MYKFYVREQIRQLFQEMDRKLEMKPQSTEDRVKCLFGLEIGDTAEKLINEDVVGPSEELGRGEDG